MSSTRKLKKKLNEEPKPLSGTIPDSDVPESKKRPRVEEPAVSGQIEDDLGRKSKKKKSDDKPITPSIELLDLKQSPSEVKQAAAAPTKELITQRWKGSLPTDPSTPEELRARSAENMKKKQRDSRIFLPNPYNQDNVGQDLPPFESKTELLDEKKPASDVPHSEKLYKEVWPGYIPTKYPEPKNINFDDLTPPGKRRGKTVYISKATGRTHFHMYPADQASDDYDKELMATGLFDKLTK